MGDSDARTRRSSSPASASLRIGWSSSPSSARFDDGRDADRVRQRHAGANPISTLLQRHRRQFVLDQQHRRVSQRAARLPGFRIALDDAGRRIRGIGIDARDRHRLAVDPGGVPETRFEVDGLIGKQQVEQALSADWPPATATRPSRRRGSSRRRRCPGGAVHSLSRAATSSTVSSRSRLHSSSAITPIMMWMCES